MMYTPPPPPHIIVSVRFSDQHEDTYDATKLKIKYTERKN